MNDLIEKYTLNLNEEESTDKGIKEAFDIAEQDIIDICNQTAKVLEDLEEAISIQEVAKEELVPICTEEDYNKLVESYALSILTGNIEQLEETCLSLQDKFESLDEKVTGGSLVKAARRKMAALSTKRHTINVNRLQKIIKSGKLTKDQMKVAQKELVRSLSLSHDFKFA